MEDFTVIAEGWVEGFEKVKVVKLLQEVGYSLAQAKEAVDEIFKGNDVFFYFESRTDACSFQENLESLRVSAQVID